jgi:hypothetical protein
MKERNILIFSLLISVFLYVFFNVVSYSWANTSNIVPISDTKFGELKDDNVRVGKNADDQALGSDRDVELTRAIRKKIVDDDKLSVEAKNIKIITLDGVTTLKGRVQNQAEKIRIVSLVEPIVGTPNLKNLLSVKNK